MKTWKVASLAAAGLVLSLSATAQAVPIVYNSYVDFLQAFPSPTVENFEDTTLQPGLSVVSTNPNAVIENGVYKDIVDDAQGFTTTWSFAGGFQAFGGWFDLYYPGGPGSSIDISYWDGSAWQYVDTIPNSSKGDFWGFSVGSPFTSVLLSEGSGVQQETYWSVDLAYKPVPEPGTMLLLGAGILGLGLMRRKRVTK